MTVETTEWELVAQDFDHECEVQREVRFVREPTEKYWEIRKIHGTAHEITRHPVAEAGSISGALFAALGETGDPLPPLETGMLAGYLIGRASRYK